jgi:hypothetical protein
MKRMWTLALVAAGIAGLATTAAGAARASDAVTLKTFLKDNFQRPSPRWHPGTYSFGSIRYAGGALHITAKGGNDVFDLYEHAISLTATDVKVAVDARKSAGIDHNNMGVVCALSSHSRYQLLIGSNGVYGITKILNGKGSVLVGGKHGTGINAHGVNRIVGDCLDTGHSVKLTLTVNGRRLAGYEDRTSPRLSIEQVGLYASSRDSSGPVDIAYDNFLATGRETNCDPVVGC